eukprot:177223_1
MRSPPYSLCSSENGEPAVLHGEVVLYGEVGLQGEVVRDCDDVERVRCVCIADPADVAISFITHSDLRTMHCLSGSPRNKRNTCFAPSMPNATVKYIVCQLIIMMTCFN